jgi:putative tryptophan/tyrosine transport system substrate-binding protein
MVDMRRRQVITLLGGAAAAWPFAARAQQSARVRRLGVLSQGSASAHPTPLFQAFRQSLRDLGWVEGQNLTIEWRFSEGSDEPLPRLAAELVRLSIDIIVATPARPALAAKEATSTIPVVFLQVPDPVELGIVANLARPGANVTGLSSIASDLSGKRLALLKEFMPAVSRVAVLWNRPSQGSALVVRDMELASKQIGLELEDIGVSTNGELKDAFESAARARVAAVMVIDDPAIASHQFEIVQLANSVALPIFSQYSEFVKGGGLMAYGPSLTDIYRRGATFVDRILKGAKPNDLPVEQPTKFDLVINLKTAKSLGLEVPPTLLARADEVIE